MRALALLLAMICQRLAERIGRLGIESEAWYHRLTEKERA